MGLKYLPNVVTLELDQERCIGCNRCIEVCPHGVFTGLEKKVPSAHGIDVSNAEPVPVTARCWP